ncbi:MAG: hypothetical protein LBH29_00230, partial [Elusimicrobiota bacterium]|nr:hypothetical protein [Elusimicrobiota bacterium]
TIKAAFEIINKIFAYFELYNYVIVLSAVLFIVLKIAVIKKQKINFMFLPLFSALTFGIGYVIADILIINTERFRLASGMIREDFYFSVGLIIFLLSAEFMQRQIGGFRQWLQRQKLPVRWAFYYAAALTIIMFGIYGGLTQASFIYFQF